MHRLTAWAAKVRTCTLHIHTTVHRLTAWVCTCTITHFLHNHCVQTDSTSRQSPHMYTSYTHHYAHTDSVSRQSPHMYYDALLTQSLYAQTDRVSRQSPHMYYFIYTHHYAQTDSVSRQSPHMYTSYTHHYAQTDSVSRQSLHMYYYALHIHTPLCTDWQREPLKSAHAITYPSPRIHTEPLNFTHIIYRIAPNFRGTKILWIVRNCEISRKYFSRPRDYIIVLYTHTFISRIIFS